MRIQLCIIDYTFNELKRHILVDLIGRGFSIEDKGFIAEERDLF